MIRIQSKRKLTVFPMEKIIMLALRNLWRGDYSIKRVEIVLRLDGTLDYKFYWNVPRHLNCRCYVQWKVR